MTGRELIKQLENIAKVHPDFLDAQIWSYGHHDPFQIELVGFDMRHKPKRIKLESR